MTKLILTGCCPDLFSSAELAAGLLSQVPSLIWPICKSSNVVGLELYSMTEVSEKRMLSSLSHLLVLGQPQEHPSNTMHHRMPNHSYLWKLNSLWSICGFNLNNSSGIIFTCNILFTISCLLVCCTCITYFVSFNSPLLFEGLIIYIEDLHAPSFIFVF